MDADIIQGQKYLFLSWDETGEICFKLAQKILAAGKPNHDRLVALAKGGWTWARTMADYLNIREIASVQYEFYTEISTTKECPTLKQSLPISVENESLLVFDDIVDSGETLGAAVEYLQKCGATSIATAVLLLKPHSRFKPDFYADSTDAWVVFPHEIREAIEQLRKKWKQAGMAEKEIEQHFLKIGLPKKQVEYFINIHG